MNKSKKEVAKFTDKELEYIYDYLDFDVNRELYLKIEKKIRKQIKRYRLMDSKAAQLLIKYGTK